MDNPPSPESNNQTSNLPEPESLKPRSDDSQPAGGAPAMRAADAHNIEKKPRHRTYQPSHKATFIGLAVVVLILAVNAGVLFFVLKGQNKANTLAEKGQVSISSSVLDQLGVNRQTIGDSGVLLTVQPNADFKGTLTVTGATNISGPLVLNSKVTGTNAGFSQLQAGNTSLGQLTVNGNGTLQNLNVGKDLVVAGLVQLQSLSTTGSATIGGNLAISGALSVSSFSARSLTSTSTLTVGGHIITNGSAPIIGRGVGGALGSNGTVSISGDDSAGVIAINIGTNATGGTLADVAFRNQYGGTPVIVITPVDVGGEFYVQDVSVGGFSLSVTSGLPPGGYRIDYIVEQ